jgi:hypothetical protein
MSVSRVHHCIAQIKVAEELSEPPAPKCRCKKFVGITEATLMVKNGEASWIVLTRRIAPCFKACHLCNADPDVKNCANCGGLGQVLGTEVIEEPGTDIVLVSRKPADKKEKKRSSALAAKTPRVATIESEHIVLAYLLNKREAQQRIEEYGRLILDARSFQGTARTPMIGIEPPDDPKTGTGRSHDYGRAI